jgi:hypothetical protein
MSKRVRRSPRPKARIRCERCTGVLRRPQRLVLCDDCLGGQTYFFGLEGQRTALQDEGHGDAS